MADVANLIEANDAQAWADANKITVNELDEHLLGQTQAEILARLGSAYDVAGWTTSATTPALVKKIIAMYYVANFYNRTYSEDEGLSEYALRLMAMAQDLMEGLTSLSITLPPEENIPTTPTTSGTVSFYPTDASSAAEPTAEDMSLGGPRFSMGQIW